MSTVLAAALYLALTAVAVAFQIGLVMGRPWGDLTMGGKFPGVLPPKMRAAAVFSGTLLVLFAVIVASRAGLILVEYAPSPGIWFVVGYCVLGVLANAATPSRRERMIWLPVVSVMLGCALVVALSSRRSSSSFALGTSRGH